MRIFHVTYKVTHRQSCAQLARCDSFQGAQQQGGRRPARRALCGCSADIVGDQIRIGDARDAHKEIQNYTPVFVLI